MFNKYMDNDLAFDFICLKSYLDCSFKKEPYGVVRDDINLEISSYVIPYLETSIKRAVVQYRYLYQCEKLFPTAFSVSYSNTSFKNNFFNRIKIKWCKIPFKNTSNRYVLMQSFCILPLIFHFQYMSFIIDDYKFNIKTNKLFCSFDEFYDACSYNINENSLFSIKISSIRNYLTQELGSEFSNGQLIDFVDRLYDLYKQTNISVKNFRTIFYCFGKYVDTIGGDAFDLYMSNRDSLMSWQSAVANFIGSYYYFTPEFSMYISKKLFVS